MRYFPYSHHIFILFFILQCMILVFPEILLSLKDVYFTGDIIIATMSDNNYASYLKPWYDRIRFFGHEDTIIIESMDDDVDKACNVSRLLCTKFNSQKVVDIRIMDKKPYFQLNLLQTGRDVLFCDIDILWQKDILQGIRSHAKFNSSDLIITGHGYNEYVNIGLMYIKSNDRTISFFTQLYKNMINKHRKPEAYDQNVFNAMLNIGDIRYKRFPPIIDQLNMTYTILDKNLFTEWDGKRWGVLNPVNTFYSLHLTSMSQANKMICVNEFYGSLNSTIIGVNNYESKQCITTRSNTQPWKSDTKSHVVKAKIPRQRQPTAFIYYLVLFTLILLLLRTVNPCRHMSWHTA